MPTTRLAVRNEIDDLHITALHNKIRRQAARIALLKARIHEQDLLLLDLTGESEQRKWGILPEPPGKFYGPTLQQLASGPTSEQMHIYEERMYRLNINLENNKLHTAVPPSQKRYLWTRKPLLPYRPLARLDKIELGIKAKAVVKSARNDTENKWTKLWSKQS